MDWRGLFLLGRFSTGWSGHEDDDRVVFSVDKNMWHRLGVKVFLQTSYISKGKEQDISV